MLSLSRRLETSTALKLLKSLPKDSVSAVILDPPALFGIGSEDEETQVDEMIAGFLTVSHQVFRVLAPGGASIFLGTPRSTSAWEVVASWAGLSLSAEIIVLWLGSDPALSNSMTVRWHTKPGMRYGFPMKVTVPSNVVVCSAVPAHSRHCPTQMPIELFNYLISLLAGKGTIVDPFCGTGSALIAAEMCGHRWIGGDKDENKIDIAKRRLMLIDIEELKPMYLWVEGRLQKVEG